MRGLPLIPLVLGATACAPHASGARAPAGVAADTGLAFTIPSPVDAFVVVARRDSADPAAGTWLRYATGDSLFADVVIYPGPDLAAACGEQCARAAIDREAAALRASLPSGVREESLIAPPGAGWELGRHLRYGSEQRGVRSDLFLLYAPGIRVQVRATYADTASEGQVRALAEQFPARLAGSPPGPPAVAQSAAILERATAFEITSLGAGYPLVARLTGWYRVEAERIVVQVEGGVVRSQVPDALGERGTFTGVWIAPGLGVQRGVRWEMDTLAAAAQVALRLDAGREARVRPKRFELPRRRDTVLRDRWLFFQVGATHAGLFDQPAGSKFAGYACAAADLFGPTRSSRRRAERLRTDYVNAC